MKPGLLSKDSRSTLICVDQVPTGNFRRSKAGLRRVQGQAKNQVVFDPDLWMQYRTRGKMKGDSIAVLVVDRSRVLNISRGMLELVGSALPGHSPGVASAI